MADGMRRLSRKGAITVAVVGLAIAVLVATLTVGRGSIAADLNESEEMATQVATKVVIAMTGVTPEDLNTNLKVVKSNSTGEFADQFQDQRQAYVEAVTKAGVSAEGEVVESGVVSSTGDEVVLLMAVSSVVRNSKIPEGDRRAYRMRVTVQESGERWLVSKLELVA